MIQNRATNFRTNITEEHDLQKKKIERNVCLQLIVLSGNMPDENMWKKRERYRENNRNGY